YTRIENALTNIKHRKASSMNLVEDQEEWFAKIESLKQQFEQEMDDDFNTANAIAVIFELAKEANIYLNKDQTHTKVLDAFHNALTDFLEILGIPQTDDEAELLDDEIEALIEKRINARKNKDFQLADQIRDEFKKRNIILEDTPQRTRWKRG